MSCLFGRSSYGMARADPYQSQGLPRIGDVVGGKYRVERGIGRGGMGVVMEASHLQLRERVALKFLMPAMAEQQELVTRFLREAQAAVRIKSEHVARVMDVGTLEAGTPYMVMELLEGMDLGRLVRTRGPLPVEEAVEYVLQACDAIAEAHSLGIVHRDLKPANLFLSQRADGSPLVKVLDFGISKVMVEAQEQRGVAWGDESLTTAADVLGSPRYMSPEQIRKPKDVDGRADIWSLGAILHKLLTAQSIFPAETPAAVLAAIIADPPIPLRAERPELPVELETLVLRCLEKDVSRRVQTVGELCAGLLPFCLETSRSFRRTSASFPSVNATSPSSISAPQLEASQPSLPTSGAWASAAPKAGRNRAVVVMALVAALTIFAGVGLFVWLGSGPASKTAHARRGFATAALLAAARVERPEAPPPAPPAVEPEPEPEPAPAPPPPARPVAKSPPKPVETDPLDDRQ